MIVAARRRELLALAIEAVLTVAVLASVIYVAHEFFRRGYLISPYMYNPDDTFMDWFNVLYWSYHWGAYEVWRAVYPPLSFLFVRFFSIPDCSASWPFYARSCDTVALTTMFAIWAISTGMASYVFFRRDRKTAWMRSLAFVFGLPSLYALERGNLILLTLIFFIIAYGDITRSRWWRWTSAAITINLKPYLLLPLVALLVRRDWRGFEVTGFLTLMIYLVSWGLFGQGSLLEIADAMSTWASSYAQDPWQPIFYTTSFTPMLNFGTLNLPVLSFLPSKMFEFILAAIPILIGTSQLLTLVCLGGAWLHPDALPRHRTAALLLACGLVSQNWGGYTQVLLLFLVFLEPFRRPGPAIAILAAYILSLSYEIFISEFSTYEPWEWTGWLSGRTIEHSFGLGWGQFVRPGLVAVILWALAIDTLHLLVLAHRREPVQIGVRPKLPAVPA